MKAICKRALSLELALTMCLSLVPTTAFAADDDLWTDHTQAVTPNAEGVYEISTAAELAWLAKGVNDLSIEQYEYDENWDLTYHTFRLTADIDLSDHLWVPIGSSRNSGFQAVFDGAGHSVTGMRVGSAEEPFDDGYYAGLFGYTRGEICDLRVTDSAVYAATPSSGSEIYAGLIAGEFDGYNTALRFCEAEGTVCVNGSTYGSGYAAAGRQWAS